MRTVEFKLLLKPAQIKTLESWMRNCCLVYNRSLEMRIKAWKRRKESITYNQQQKWLTEIRSRNENFSDVPCHFQRDALRRVDKGIKAFFRRIKSGCNPGFPRFKSVKKYSSISFVAIGNYVRSENLVSIPRLGLVKIKRGNQRINKTQKLLRIIRRASGWYGQVMTDCSTAIKNLEDRGCIGVDVGIMSLAATSDGSKIDNPRIYRKSEKKLRGLQRSLSRKKKGSSNRKKAVRKLARHYEKSALQRRNFCHQHSTELVRKYQFIAVEKLNIKGMIKNSRLSKSISDAGWGIFISQLKYKAANAGRLVVEVNPAGTSQECPECGAIKKKKLSERVHRCYCGCVLDRDVASSRVILDRALVATGANRLWRDSASDLLLVAVNQVDPVKQEHFLEESST